MCEKIQTRALEGWYAFWTAMDFSMCWD